LRVLYVDPDDAAKFTIEPSCLGIGRTPPIRRNRRSRNSCSVMENLLRLHRLHARESAPGLDRHRPERTSARSDDLAIDEDATRPDSRSPECGASTGVGDEELAIVSLEQEVGVAAREEPCGGRGPSGGAEGRLVAGEDPRVADRCSHRGQPLTERVERRDASLRADPRPLSERLGGGGTEDVQVGSRELESVDMPWDWMAGALLVREAGGRVTELSPANPALPRILASAPRIHDTLVDLLERATSGL
jgi:hypothetical protein